MADKPKTKYDPLEAAKLGTDNKSPEPEHVNRDSSKLGGLDKPPDKVEENTDVFDTPRAPAKARAFDVTDAVPPPAPRPKYKVKKDMRVSIRGTICDFKEGRVIDSAGYDVEALKRQGLELELIKE